MADVREQLNKYPGIALGAVAFLLLACLWGMWRGHSSSPHELRRAFYTTDDGDSYHEASLSSSGDGVKAVVFGYDGAPKPFVGYLTRKGPTGDEVKKPGPGNPWVPVPPPPGPGSTTEPSAPDVEARAKYESITRVKGPNGETAVMLVPNP